MPVRGEEVNWLIGEEGRTKERWNEGTIERWNEGEKNEPRRRGDAKGRREEEGEEGTKTFTRNS